MQLSRSLSDSPAINCELEKTLLSASFDEDVLLFYVNRPAVIVGRNQSIIAEVNIAYCNAHGIEIIKRISGGGAVYHDYGNINYAFIIRNHTESVIDMDFATPIVAALKALGIRATVGTRKELLVDGRKISGTSSHTTRDRILFHGTLLHNVNLTHLSEALKGDPSQRGRHIASIPATVMNISEITGTNETTEQFLDKLLEYLMVFYKADKIHVLPSSQLDSLNTYFFKSLNL